MNGKFIVLEGIDGSGKTTIANKLFKYYESNSAVHTTLCMEPSSSSVGRLAREKLYSELCVQDSFLHLLLADRAEQNSYRSLLLKAGELIFLDRYYYSTFAYQSLNYSFKELDTYHELFKPALIRPDLTLIIDVPVEIAIRRLNSRQNKSCFDACKDTTRICKNYQMIKRLSNFCSKDSIIYIDGDRDEADVFTSCLTEAERVLSV